MSYIEREEFYKTMIKRFGCVPSITDHSSTLRNDIHLNEALDLVPTADVAKVKHGKWEEEYLGYGTYRYRCSECNSTFGEDAINEFHHKNYCSNCGARMDLEEREEE